MNRTTTLPSAGRALLALLTVVLAATVALTVVLMAVAPKSADAEPRIITKTFSKSQLIEIPREGKASPYPSSITASFPRGSKVRDVNVVLRGYEHSYTPDVDVMLGHPGTTRTIMSDVGEDTIRTITLRLDDEAANPLPKYADLAGGRYKPRNVEGRDFFPFPAGTVDPRARLSGFDGKYARGKWNLFVKDDSEGDRGEFGGGWTIRIRAAVP
jgi:subtilisin-like proprotein convertase family protein